jgi:hypothetical protein
MGLRVRLKASVNISRLPYQARVVAEAVKLYGMILADDGSSWYISGAPSPHWNDDALHQLDQLIGRDFEVVDTSSLPHPGLQRPSSQARDRALPRGWGAQPPVTDSSECAGTRGWLGISPAADRREHRIQWVVAHADP